MERVFLVCVAVILGLYFVVTEWLDWIGRIGVIREHFPRIPEILERRSFRVVLLLLAIALLVRVITDHGNPSIAPVAVTEPRPVATQPSALPAPSGSPQAGVQSKPKPKQHAHNNQNKPKPAPATVIKGADNTVVGNDTPSIEGNGNTYVGATDANGNSILNHGGVAIRKGAKADSTSIAIGSGAGAGKPQEPSPTPAGQTPPETAKPPQ
jgi:hypothetical protein